jgi:hypothetical protein
MRPVRRFLDAQVYGDRLAAQEASRPRPPHAAAPAPPGRPAEWAARAHWARLDVAPFLPPDGELDRAHAAVVIVNRSAWIARCPFCPGAQYAHRDDQRWFCVDCLNERNGFRWVPAPWPEEADAIEAALAVRPTAVCNWEPPETAAQLRAENRLMGWG